LRDKRRFGLAADFLAVLHLDANSPGGYTVCARLNHFLTIQLEIGDRLGLRLERKRLSFQRHLLLYTDDPNLAIFRKRIARRWDAVVQPLEGEPGFIERLSDRSGSGPGLHFATVKTDNQWFRAFEVGGQRACKRGIGVWRKTIACVQCDTGVP
jgi:hypothetical protein